MEYAVHRRDDLTSLLDRSITPWTGPKDSDANLVYDAQHEWSAYDLTRNAEADGVIRELGYHDPLPL